MRKIFSFLNFYLKPELKFILKKDLSKLTALTTILFIALLSIGLANGSFEKVKIKANDPHIQFIDIEQSTKTDVDGNYVKFFSYKDLENWADSTLTSYQISSLDISNIDIFQYSSLFKESNFMSREFDGIYGTIMHQDDIGKKTSVLSKKALLIEKKNKFFEKLRDQDNSLDSTFNDSTIGIIIKKEFLTEYLKYEHIPSHVYILTRYNKPIPVPVLGVVKNIKSGCNIVLTKELYNNIYRFSEKMNYDTYTDFYYFISDKEFNDTNYIPSKTKKLLTNRTAYFPKSRIKGNYYQYEGDKPLLKGQRVLNFSKHPIQKKSSRKEKNFTVFLGDLNEVDLLKDWVKSNGVELELSKIENKKNFNFFVTLCSVLIFAIIFFAVISVLFFVSNIMFSHIDRNKKNIGTLSAFGLSNLKIIFLYSLITFLIVALSFFVSNFISEIIGNLINSREEIFSFKNDFSFLSNNFLIFSFIPDILLKFLIFVMMPLIHLIVNIYLYIYKLSPGDLIYNRN